MLRTVSSVERYKKGYIPQDETKEWQQGVSTSAWTQFYHKPYQCDWKEARQKAIERKWRYNE